MNANRRLYDAMSRPVITVTPQSSAEHAAWLLAEHSIGVVTSFHTSLPYAAVDIRYCQAVRDSTGVR